MARRRLVRCPWALALITGIHQAEGVADPARRTLPPSTGSGGTPIVPGGTPYSTATDAELLNSVLRVLSCGSEWGGGRIRA